MRCDFGGEQSTATDACNQKLKCASPRATSPGGSALPLHVSLNGQEMTCLLRWVLASPVPPRRAQRRRRRRWQRPTQRRTALRALDLSEYNGGVALDPPLTEEQAAVALQAANGTADGDVAAAWLQQALSDSGVAGLEAAVSQVLLAEFNGGGGGGGGGAGLGGVRQQAVGAGGRRHGGHRRDRWRRPCRRRRRRQVPVQAGKLTTIRCSTATRLSTRARSTARSSARRPRHVRRPRGDARGEPECARVLDGRQRVPHRGARYGPDGHRPAHPGRRRRPRRVTPLFCSSAARSLRVARISSRTLPLGG